MERRMRDTPPVRWTVIVLTCQYKDSVHVFQQELVFRQKRGWISSETLLLTVADPQAALGSGGATLNALLVAAEHLSARHGYTVISSDALKGARILILHMGRDFPFDNCGRAFSWLPTETPPEFVDEPAEGPVCNIDLLLSCFTHKVAPGSPPGVWVSSSDMLIQIPTALDISWSGFTGVKVLSLPGDVEYAKNHGVYLTDHRGRVCDIIYRGSSCQIQACALQDGKVPLVSGIVFFSKDVAELLLQTHVIHPLDACTYLGLDSGTPPLQLSLFFDILLCLACNVTQDEYLNGQRHSNSKEQVDGTLRNARTVLWKELRGIPLTLEYIPNGTYNYMSLSGEQHIRNMTQRLRDTLGRNTTNMTWAHVENPQLLQKDCIVINSFLEGDVIVAAGSVIQHCHLRGPLTVKSGCILSGIDLQSSISLQDCTLSDIIIQGHYVKLGDERRRVFTVLGRQDNLEVSLADSMSSFLNNSWTELFKRTGIRIGELWQPAEDEGKSLSLYDTYLFPVLHMHGPVGVEGVLWLSGLNKEDRLSLWRAAWRMSMREILNCLDQEAELNWRKELFFQTARLQAQDTLRNRMNCSLWPLIRAAVQENQQNDLLAALDTVAAETPHPGVAARTLAAVADVLGCMAERKGGLRSGPAANPAWNSAFRLLETGELQSGVKALAAERKNWLSRPDLLVRAARHYEAAGQILIRQAVATAREFIKIGNCDAPPFNQWVEVECPARLDIAGGWSDTPPITFEHGGAVVNIAVQVDGRRPIGARARRIRDPCLLLISHSGSQGHQVTTETICRTMKDINDYCQPHAPNALLKAACICAELIQFPSKHCLQEQIVNNFGGGFEIQCWSTLPHGSGLGTSSILAGAIMAAIYESAGRSYSTEALLHVILHLEQILTTGGGWQDQVGGLLPGIKIGRSKAQLPLRVEVEPISVPPGFTETFNQHLLLIYTGKTRLARNLLQDVVRSWYARLPFIVENTDQLVNTAEACAEAFRQGSLTQIGSSLDQYWQQKKVMARGCEPTSVSAMMAALKPLALGQSLAGAGGGGFLYLLTKEPHQADHVRDILSKTEGVADFSIHHVEVDLQGVLIQKKESCLP
ncbi:L-fucose kinase isoform X2 [Polypterus senegalus]|nr:L-fucose kinase isoform X2 [Polypterus senegalus]